LLRSRGLVIQDDNKVERWLTNVSYYRLGGYFWPLQSDKVRHIFIPGTTWEIVTDRYEFDRELRITVFAAIERIEISVRTRLIYELSNRYHPNWFDDLSLFKNGKHFKDNLSLIDKELSKSKEDSILNHYKKYSSKQRPPAWKTLEILSFGVLSKLYSNLKDATIKNNLARALGIPHYTILESWLQSINIIRNICAHHGRLWDRSLKISIVQLNNAPDWLTISVTGLDLKKLYLSLCALQYLLTKIGETSSFAQRIKELLHLYPGLETDMGFPNHWKTEPMWL